MMNRVLIVPGLLSLVACGVSNDPGGVQGSASALSVNSVSNDESYLYYSISFNTRPTNLQIFVDDAESNGATFAIGEINADYLIEASIADQNAKIYKYSGSGSTWSWTQQTGTATLSANSGRSGGLLMVAVTAWSRAAAGRGPS